MIASCIRLDGLETARFQARESEHLGRALELAEITVLRVDDGGTVPKVSANYDLLRSLQRLSIGTHQAAVTNTHACGPLFLLIQRSMICPGGIVGFSNPPGQAGRIDTGAGKPDDLYPALRPGAVPWP